VRKGLYLLKVSLMRLFLTDASTFGKPTPGPAEEGSRDATTTRDATLRSAVSPLFSPAITQFVNTVSGQCSVHREEIVGGKGWQRLIGRGAVRCTRK
jgi:hypothetical protein